MTKISGLIFLVYFISSSAFGQTQNLILTKDQNNRWLDSLKTLTITQQLVAINERLYADTNVFVRQFYNDRIRIIDSLGNRVYGDGKPTLVIGGYPMIIDNGTQNIKIIHLTELLTTDYIKNINILRSNDPMTTAVYGIQGLNGIILMSVKKKKYLRKFRRQNLKSNGYTYR